MTTFIDDSSNPNSPRQSNSPFRDPESKRGNEGDKALSRVIEEAARRASSRPKSGLATRTPFGDEHSIDE